MTREELHDILAKEIRLYPHLGIEIVSASPSQVRFSVKLAANSNHKGTGFGGSLYSAAVLAAYSVVLVSMAQEGLTSRNIVIQKGSMEYLRPVTEDFEVVCDFVDKSRFFASLQRWRKAREELSVEIFCGGELGARLDGTFVVKT